MIFLLKFLKEIKMAFSMIKKNLVLSSIYYAKYNIMK